MTLQLVSSPTWLRRSAAPCAIPLLRASMGSCTFLAALTASAEARAEADKELLSLPPCPYDTKQSQHDVVCIQSNCCTMLTGMMLTYLNLIQLPTIQTRLCMYAVQISKNAG